MKTKFLPLLFATFIFIAITSCSNNGMMNKDNDMTAKNKATIQKLDDAFDAGNAAMVDSLLTSDAVDHQPPPPGMTGSMQEILKQMISGFHAAFPNGKSTITAMTAEGDMVVQYGTFKGTNSGSFMGMPATNAEVSFDFADAFKMKDGKVAEHWGMIDMATMMKQMGMMPPPPPPPGDTSMVKKDMPK